MITRYIKIRFSYSKSSTSLVTSHLYILPVLVSYKIQHFSLFFWHVLSLQFQKKIIDNCTFTWADFRHVRLFYIFMIIITTRFIFHFLLVCLWKIQRKNSLFINYWYWERGDNSYLLTVFYLYTYLHLSFWFHYKFHNSYMFVVWGEAGALFHR